MKTKCMASAPTKAELEKLINEYYYSTEYFVNDNMQAENKNGKIIDDHIVKVDKHGRWSFRRII